MHQLILIAALSATTCHRDKCAPTCAPAPVCAPVVVTCAPAPVCEPVVKKHHCGFLKRRSCGTCNPAPVCVTQQVIYAAPVASPQASPQAMPTPQAPRKS